MEKKIQQIFEKAYHRESITKEECVALLSLEDASSEALIMRGLASDIVRTGNDNTAAIFGQIGFECSPCDGNCSFCSCAKDYTMMGTFSMDNDTIAQSTKAFTQDGSLHVLYMMTMASFSLDEYLRKVEIVKENICGTTKLVSNVGDSDYETFKEMKAAGIDGAYHCWRLGEGKDTTFDPEARKETINNARKAGLEIYDALEPIGCEHTPQEMAEHIFFSIEMETVQSGAMKRISVPGTPFEKEPMLTDFTLSKYTAALVLSMAGMKKLPWIGIHEPSIQGYMSGANMISAETGINPRDTVENTSTSRGLDVAACKEIMKKAGFKYIAAGDGTKIIL